MNQTKLRPLLLKALPPLLLVICALTIAAVLMLLIGYNPLEAYAALIKGAFGDAFSIITTINKALPICMASFAVGLAAKAGVFNIGAEGQLMMGAFGSALFGIYITGLPAALHIPVALLGGGLFGALWALPGALLYVGRGTNIIVSALLTNSIAGLLLTYLIVGPFSGGLSYSATAAIQPTAELPYLITSPAKMTIAAPIVLAIAVIFYFYMHKTVDGYELRAVGMNETAARFVGIHGDKYVLLSLVVGGMLAGMAGALEVQGNYHRLYDKFSPGYGFDGIPIALIANGNPFIMIVGSLFFGALRAGSQNMQMVAGVKKEIVTVIQGLLIVFIAAQYIFRHGVSLFLGEKRKGAAK